MERLFLPLLLVLCPFLTASAQINLVPNGNFEYYSTCPTSTAQLANATGWNSYQSTPDYFNSCYSSGIVRVGVPTNRWGSENAVSGNAYAGASFYYGRREALTRAIGPLTPLRSYEVSMSISLADHSRYAVDGIGAYFFDHGATSVSNNHQLVPQVDFSSDGVVTTKSGWVRLTAYFVADSSYDNIVIGNFQQDSVLSFVALNSGSINHAYYYFDSIVVRAENVALRYRDSLLCAGDSLIVPFFANSDSFNTGNVFTLQLSDTSGSFVSGTTTLTSVTGRTSGIFRTVVPSTLVGSSQYRIRVVSSNRPATSRDNGRNIAIGTIRPNKPVATGNTPVCTADTLRLNATTTTAGTFSWHWKGPNNFTSAQQNPKIGNPTSAAVGSYYVTVFSYGCFAKDTIAVLIKTSPTAIVASSNSAICEQDTLKLYSTASSLGVVYNWTGPNGFSSSSQNTTIVNTPTLANGKYHIIATAANGCFRRDSVIVTVKPKPFVVAANSGPACMYSSAGLTATVNITGTNFLWSGPGSYVSTNQNPSISPALTGSAGVYTVTATLNGCTDTASTTLGVNPLPSLSISSNSPVCESDTIKFFSTAATAIVYSWTGPGSFSAATANPYIASASGINDGSYSMTVTDSNGCTSTDSVNVTIQPLPVSYASNSGAVCAGISFALDANTTYSGVSFLWSGPNGFSSVLPNPIVCNPPASASGAYMLTATMNGCSYTTTTFATIHPIPVARPGAHSPVCLGETIQLTANNLTGAIYQWTGPAYNSTSQNSSVAATSTAQSGDYVLVVTANGCVSEPDTVNVEVNVLPKIGGYVSPNDTICRGAIPTFVAFVKDGGPGAVAQWYTNHVPVGAPNVLQYSPAAVNNGDVYYCKLTAPGVCYATLTLYTDTINMTVLSAIPKPKVTITANPGLHVRPSDMVRFTADVKHGGRNPKYQWFRNGLKQTGAIYATYDATGLSYMDMVHVDITSEDPCVQDKNASDTVWMQFPTAVQNVNSSNVKLYPNPNNGSFIIAGITTHEVNVEIVNSIGQTVYLQPAKVVKGQVQLDAGLVPGCYLLRFSMADVQQALRFTVF
jgi:hypothetical protein